MLTLLPTTVTLAVLLSATGALADDIESAERAREAWVDSTLAAMPLERKAAQMVMPWIIGGAITAPADLRRIEALAGDHGVGGFIVGRGAAEGTRRTLERLQGRSAVPLLIGSDLERGPGMRLVGTTLFPAHMAIAASGSPAFAYRQGRATAEEGRRYGIHMAFAPVADVNIDPLNPIINTRAFGSDPARVGVFVAEYARGLREGGMIAVAKHFPGHGDTRVDSHLALPVIDATRARLDSVELVPFRSAIAAGVGGIMSAHIALPAVTGSTEPATLSREIITGLLREELGFDGLIVTDALNMAGVTRYAEAPEVILRSVTAGADILLQPADPLLAIRVIVEAVNRGDITEDRLDASVRRILRAKAELGLHDSTSAAREEEPMASLRQRHEALAREIATRSITLVRDTAAAIPMNPGGSLTLVIYADRVSASTGASFERALREAGWRVEAFRLSRASTPARIEAARVASLRPDTRAVVASYTQAVPWSGTVGLSRPVGAMIGAVSARRPLIYVTFGDPYLISGLPNVAAYLIGWSDAPVAQQAASDALAGRAPITGSLPIDIPPHHPIGHGLRRELVATELPR